MAIATQMNVRLDAGLKAQGDDVFQRNGITPSQAVRGMWEYVAQTGKLPDFLRPRDDQSDIERKCRLVRESRGLALKLAYPGLNLQGMGVDSNRLEHREVLMDDMYEEMLDDIHSMLESG
jgi:addiction module RelB/DinJ family antitoxin